MSKKNRVRILRNVDEWIHEHDAIVVAPIPRLKNLRVEHTKSLLSTYKHSLMLPRLFPILEFCHVPKREA